MTVLDKFRLDDKVVVVTGASSGLGVSFAKSWLRLKNLLLPPDGGPSASKPTSQIDVGVKRW
jgi:hypothetical protein